MNQDISISKTDYRYIQNMPQKHIYSYRQSLLDKDNEGLKYNLFHGLYNFMVIVIYVYMIATPLLRYIKKNEFIDPYIIQRMKEDIILAILAWPLFYLWSHMAFLNQILVEKGLNKIMSKIIQHSTQLLLFIYTHYLVFSKQLFVTHGIYISFQACVFVMKMHSYNEVNNQLRKQDQKDQKDQKSKTRIITIRNFNQYLWMPVLVYQTTYLQTQNKIRIAFLIKTFITSILLIFLSYLIVSENILPIIRTKSSISLIESLSQAVLPICCVCLSTFVMLFENYLQFFAEITQFGDRLFYLDWWNASGIEDFNRKWNRPVHMFLHKHVYSEAINFGISKQSAQLITISVSAILHEFCIAVALQQLRPILLFLMVFQIPIFVGIKYFKITILESNLFMWFSVIIGVPLIIILYIQLPD